MNGMDYSSLCSQGVVLGTSILRLFYNPMEDSGGLVDPPLAVTWPYIVCGVIATLFLFVLHCLAWMGKLYTWTAAPSHPLAENHVNLLKVFGNTLVELSLKPQGPAVHPRRNYALSGILTSE